MPSVARELTVFVASPGDCEVERQRVRDAAEQVNQELGANLGLRISVSGWEHVSPDVGRPQARINDLIDRCDIFVGILGYRWGSSTGTHESGFQEEFERVRARRGNSNVPHVALYFRSVPSAMLADPGPQLKRVLRFRERLEKENLALYQTFDGPDHFATCIWRLFAHLLVREASRLSLVVSDGTQGLATGTELAPTIPDDTLSPDEVDDARRQIVGAASSVIQAAMGDEDISVDVDRLTLLALAIGNEGVLSSHVANRLHRRRHELVLAHIEGTLWLRTLMVDMGRNASRAGRVIPAGPWSITRTNC